jgi:ABC-type multidrug transport system fused ATPase/permease subunit
VDVREYPQELRRPSDRSGRFPLLRHGARERAPHDLRIDDEQVRRSIDAIGAERFVDELPTDSTPGQASGAALSTGQKQLLAFARA